jgi:hypothetical protein
MTLQAAIKDNQKKNETEVTALRNEIAFLRSKNEKLKVEL